MTEYYWDGKNWLELKIYGFAKEYYLGDKLHRKDDPAVIYYYNDGTIEREKYYYKGQLHMKYLPAIITFDNKQQIKRTEYYSYGVKQKSIFDS